MLDGVYVVLNRLNRIIAITRQDDRRIIYGTRSLRTKDFMMFLCWFLKRYWPSFPLFSSVMGRQKPWPWCKIGRWNQRASRNFVPLHLTNDAMGHRINKFSGISKLWKYLTKLADFNVSLALKKIWLQSDMLSFQGENVKFLTILLFLNNFVDSACHKLLSTKLQVVIFQYWWRH